MRLLAPRQFTKAEVSARPRNVRRKKGTMRKRYLLSLLMSFGVCSNARLPATAQDNVRIFVDVNLVQLNVAITDGKGRYVSGLSPQDFIISEDRIPQKIATFEEGNGPTRRLIDNPW